MNLKYLTLDKAKLLGNASIDSQLKYAPRTWIFLPENYLFKNAKQLKLGKTFLSLLPLMMIYCN